MNCFVRERCSAPIWTATVYVAGMACLAGCGGSSGSKRIGYQGELVQIQGIVTLDGEPLSEATINFVADGPPPPGFTFASGLTDSSGKYQLRTDGELGVPPGRYKIGIERWATPDGTPFRSNPEDGMDIEQAKMSGLVKQIVPEKYNDPSKGRVTIEITKTHSEPVNFDMTSK